MVKGTSQKPSRTPKTAARFPPEIWLRILRWATFVPNAIDIDAPDALSYPPPLGQSEIQNEVRRSLRTKRALVLVCRQWKELSSRFLFEAVYVGLTKTVWRLSEGVGGKETGSFQKALLWTKRLDFAIRDTSKKNFSKNREFLTRALSLHRLMPNLEIFVARRTDPLTVFMQRLFTNFALGSPTQQHKVTVFDSTHRLLDCPLSRTRMIKSPFPTPQYNYKKWGASTIELNSWSVIMYHYDTVRHLHIQPDVILPNVAESLRKLASPLRAPNLRYLVITDWFPYCVEVENEDQDEKDVPFHLAYWGCLTAPEDSSLSFEFYLTHSPGLSTRLTTFECGRTHDMDIPGLLELVSKHCPNVMNIILTVPTWMSLIYALPTTKLPKTVQRLGLRSFKEVSRRSVMKDLCDRICRVSEKSSSLKVVRFMGRQASRNLREVNQKVGLQTKERMDSRGILLEGFDGHPLLQ